MLNILRRARLDQSRTVIKHKLSQAIVPSNLKSPQTLLPWTEDGEWSHHNTAVVLAGSDKYLKH